MVGVLPKEGIVKVTEIAEWLETDQETVIKRLVKAKVPIIKLSGHKSGWLFRIEDLGKNGAVNA